MDWGSSYPQRALHNLTYGPIAGRGTLDRNHNASCTRRRPRLDVTHPKRGQRKLAMTKTVATSDYPPLIDRRREFMRR